MSISDRLDQIAREAIEADEQWDRGRSAFNANNHAPPIDIALANGERTLAALRAVLDLCEKTPLRYQTPLLDESFMVLGTDVIRSEIAAALGEGS